MRKVNRKKGIDPFTTFKMFAVGTDQGTVSPSSRHPEYMKLFFTRKAAAKYAKSFKKYGGRVAVIEVRWRDE
jgi:hypothetical protein